MTLRLFDTATRALEDFEPVRAGHVGIYLCGPTVQSSPHVGHLRSAVAFDVLQRWLEHTGHEVTVVRNVTDVGDKIFSLAAEAGVEWWAWALRYEREFQAAYAAVGVKPPAAEPRATGHIPEIVELTAALVERGHAYERDGSVYFDVRSWDNYGALTNQRLEDLAPAQDSPDADKRDPRDFALWKAAKDGEPATAAWNSPWGPGRPGWHIECSAMAQRYLGEAFDIHGGGLDLRFPHHENEMAQSHAAGHPFARVWLHSAWVTLSGTKMSKSLGNTALVSAVMAGRNPAALRLALAGVHYRSMLEWGDRTLDDAEASWARIAGFVERAGELVGQPSADEVRGGAVPAAFAEAMDDDLAVPRALAAIHDAIGSGNTALTAGDKDATSAALLAVRTMLAVLGLDPEDPQWKSARGDGGATAALDALIGARLEARAAAREAKDWAAADAIRDDLAAAGIVIEDGADGARWSLADEA